MLREEDADPVSKEAAELYDEHFVPANFQHWAVLLSNAAALRPGESVLDVGCGTGALTREAAKRVRPDGRVVGLDRSPNMLAVARRRLPGAEFFRGYAESLPFADHTFDTTLSQLAIMFFASKAQALREMYRVTRPGGRVWLAICGPLDESSGYSAMASLLRRYFREALAREYLLPFAFGDQTRIRGLFSEARIPLGEVTRVSSKVRYKSLQDWIYTDFKGWTLAKLIDEDTYNDLLAKASTELSHFVSQEGRVEFEMTAYFVGTCRAST